MAPCKTSGGAPLSRPAATVAATVRTADRIFCDHCAFSTATCKGLAIHLRKAHEVILDRRSRLRRKAADRRHLLQPVQYRDLTVKPPETMAAGSFTTTTTTTTAPTFATKSAASTTAPPAFKYEPGQHLETPRPDSYEQRQHVNGSNMPQAVRLASTSSVGNYNDVINKEDTKKANKKISSNVSHISLNGSALPTEAASSSTSTTPCLSPGLGPGHVATHTTYASRPLRGPDGQLLGWIRTPVTRKSAPHQGTGDHSGGADHSGSERVAVSQFSAMPPVYTTSPLAHEHPASHQELPLRHAAPYEDNQVPGYLDYRVPYFYPDYIEQQQQQQQQEQQLRQLQHHHEYYHHLQPQLHQQPEQRPEFHEELCYEPSYDGRLGVYTQLPFN